jgi:hypothetical protein
MSEGLALPIEIINHIFTFLPEHVLYKLWSESAWMRMYCNDSVLSIIRKYEWGDLYYWITTHRNFRLWFNKTESFEVTIIISLYESGFILLRLCGDDADSIIQETMVAFYHTPGTSSFSLRITVYIDTVDYEDVISKPVMVYNIEIERIVYWKWMGWVEVFGSLEIDDAPD